MPLDWTVDRSNHRYLNAQQCGIKASGIAVGVIQGER